MGFFKLFISLDSLFLKFQFDFVDSFIEVIDNFHFLRKEDFWGRSLDIVNTAQNGFMHRMNPLIWGFLFGSLGHSRFRPIQNEFGNYGVLRDLILQSVNIFSKLAFSRDGFELPIFDFFADFLELVLFMLEFGLFYFGFLLPVFNFEFVFVQF